MRFDTKRLGWHYLAFGLWWAWLAGVGRYWDNHRAETWQHFGLGSVAYCFVLSLVLWLLIWPLKPRGWSYRNVLTFVSLTSPPAVLYALPVERWTDMGTAAMLNVLFLGIVALWRVVLYVLYLARAADLRGLALFVASTMPLMLVVGALTMLNLEHVVFRIMAGLQPGEASAADGAYVVTFLLAALSTYGFPIVLLMYFGAIWNVRAGDRRGVGRSDFAP